MRPCTRGARDVVAVTPLIGGRAVKGPLAEMLQSLGREQSAVGVAEHLADVAGAFVLDAEDAALAPRIAALGLRAIVAPTLMRDAATRRALARAALDG